MHPRNTATLDRSKDPPLPRLERLAPKIRYPWGKKGLAVAVLEETAEARAALLDLGLGAHFEGARGLALDTAKRNCTAVRGAIPFAVAPLPTNPWNATRIIGVAWLTLQRGGNGGLDVTVFLTLPAVGNEEKAAELVLQTLADHPGSPRMELIPMPRASRN
jgi:hypothetical protein